VPPPPARAPPANTFKGACLALATFAAQTSLNGGWRYFLCALSSLLFVAVITMYLLYVWSGTARTDTTMLVNDRQQLTTHEKIVQVPAPGPIADPAKLPTQWLGLVCLQAVFVLAFQVAAGWLASSIALIADTAHSSIDVIGYGLNYCTEYLKVTGLRESRERPAAATTEFARRLDAAGAMISTAILMITTWYSTAEALQRFRAAPPLLHTEQQSIGLALLAFAIVSAISNVALLVMFYRLRMSGDWTPTHMSAPPYVESDALVCSPCGDDATGFATTKVPRCTCPLGSSSHSSSCNRPSWSSLIHMALHPGCTGEHGQDTEVPMFGRGDSANNPPAVASADLNISAAILHLVADILRGVTMFVAAIIIEAGLADPLEADAVCAILVAAFTVVGAAALLRRAGAAMCRDCFA